MTKPKIAICLALLSTAVTANAETYNYLCKVDGKAPHFGWMTLRIPLNGKGRNTT